MKKAICLISGGIDSPVAAAMLSGKYEIIPLHFCHYPYYCKGSFERMIKIMNHLKKKTEFKKLILFPWAPVLSKVLKSDRNARKYMCVLCRKAMLKVAEKIAKKEKASVIITGESLAQKASQTLPNLVATSYGISTTILRPLIGLDKTEIEQISREMGLWFEKHVGCCTAVPKKPTTKANIEKLNKIYEELNIDKIIDKNFKKILKLKSLDPDSEHLSLFLKKLDQ